MKGKIFYLEKANGKIQLKRSLQYFSQTHGQVSQLKRVSFDVYVDKNVPLYVDTNIWGKFLATYFNMNWVFLQMGCCSRVAKP